MTHDKPTMAGKCRTTKMPTYRHDANVPS